jgi:hypothetical protein
MRIPILIAGLLAAGAAPRLAAQTDVSLRVGVTGWSTLVHDFIAQDVDVKASVAPTIFLGIGHSIAPRYGAALELAATAGSLHSDYGDVRADLGSGRTASALALLDGGISAGFRWRAGLGFLHYFAGDEGSVLASGTTRLLVGAGLDFRRPVLSKWDVLIAARYDFHRFSSPALKAHGYAGAQGVQRVSLSVGLARGHR